jgi:glutamate-1-semialdehyde 2,1-aminomutase
MNSPEHPLIQAYRSFSPASAQRAERARTVFPGGDTRSSAHYGPYPLVMDHAEGAQLTDVDGNVVLDFMNNFTSLIHGHAHPAVVDAVQRQVAQGSAYAAPSMDQIELAELIVERVPSIQQMRFTSSGTEGTQMAIRAARASTGRQKIMKMEGGYHGSYELAEVSLVPLPNESGPLDAPVSQPVDASFPNSVLADTVICPYNETAIARSLIEAHAADLAAVIVEPVLGSMGMLPATTEFLQALRDATAAHDIVLIFDEVITLRLNAGGAQTPHGITPDLTCMGKIIGGGLPVGAMGGKRELMQLFSPEQERPVMHASTFSGNALTMAAGLAAMQNYDQDQAARINELGEQLREGFNGVFRQAGLRARAMGKGSLTNVLFTDGPVNNARDFIAATLQAGHIPKLLHLTMLRHGVMSATRLMYCTSTAMDSGEIQQAINAMAASVEELAPYIAAERPGLLAV